MQISFYCVLSLLHKHPTSIEWILASRLLGQVLGVELKKFKINYSWDISVIAKKSSWQRQAMFLFVKEVREILCWHFISVPTHVWQVRVTDWTRGVICSPVLIPSPEILLGFPVLIQEFTSRRSPVNLYGVIGMITHQEIQHFITAPQEQPHLFSWRAKQFHNVFYVSIAEGKINKPPQKKPTPNQK